MIIAHIPAGFLLTRGTMKIAGMGGESQRKLMIWGLACSILPDVDLIYGWLLAPGRIHHHRYVTHWPFFWLAIVLIWAILMVTGVVRARWHLVSIFALNVLVHLVLDWIVSAMWLLEPFSHEVFNLVTVPNRYHPWYLNFLWFWTAWLEVGITAAALLLALIDARERMRATKAASIRFADVRE